MRLGFVPPEFVDPEKTASVVPQLSRVLGQLVQGGGARKVNIQQVFNSPPFLMTMYEFYSNVCTILQCRSCKDVVELSV